MQGPAIPPVSLRALLSLAWPVVISRSTQVVVGLCDALLVSALGAAPLAATTSGAINTFTLAILPMGIVFIVSTFASQLHGAGDSAGARRFGVYGLMVAGAAQVLCVAAIAAVPWALVKLNYADDVRRPMEAYLRVRLWSGGAIVGMEALANYYGGIGNTRLPMLASVGAMVLNVLGCWLLIAGRAGAPALGVAGAGWAAALATTTAFAVLLGRFVRDARAAGPRALGGGLSLRELGRMLRFGIPSGLNWFLEFAAFTFFVDVVVTGLGTTALAAMMAVIQMNSVAFMPAFGIASAGAILVGQSIGAGARDQVGRVVKLAFWASTAWQCVVGVVCLVAPRPLLGLFAHGEEAAELVGVGAQLLVVMVAWQLVDSAATTLAEALRAAGDTAFTFWMRLVIAWGVFVPGSWWTVRHRGWGPRGAAAWLVIYLSLLALALFLRFRGGAWRRFDLAREAPNPASD